jgi:hypothetical protein
VYIYPEDKCSNELVDFCLLHLPTASENASKLYEDLFMQSHVEKARPM